jgi:hypothetical protein
MAADQTTSEHRDFVGELIAWLADKSARRRDDLNSIRPASAQPH